MRALLLVLLPLVASLSLAAAPAEAAKRLTKCQKVARDYEDLSKASSYVVAVRDNGAGGEDLLGCRLPAGKVCEAGRSSACGGLCMRLRAGEANR